MTIEFSMISRWRDYYSVYARLGFPIAVAGFVLLKLGVFLQRCLEFRGERLFFATTMLAHDAMLVGFALLAFIGSVLVPSRALSVVLKGAICVALLVYIGDIVALKVFYTRLAFDDLAKYGGDAHSVWSVAQQIATTKTALLLLVLLGCALPAALIFVTVRQRPSNRAFAAISGVIVLTFGVWGLFAGPSHVHAWAFRNVFEANLGRGLNSSYSEGFEQACLAQTPLLARQRLCAAGENTQPNIILVVVESLSSHHSKLFSGLSNTVPNVDRIARDGSAYTHFYANGFTTAAGLIAMLTGQFPIPAVNAAIHGNRFAFAGFFDSDPSLARTLSRAGYRTEFLTTGNLRFSNKGAWLESLGFDVIEGHTHPFYNDWERYHFEAAPDEALYGRVLASIAANRAHTPADDTPFFMLLETVSTHPPYLNPRTGGRSEHAAFQYADEELGRFYDRLRADSFFANGVLIVTGDHRSMTPVKSSERERFGRTAASRVPLVIVTGNRPTRAIVDAPFQQVDMIPSLRSLVTHSFCLTTFQRSFLAPVSSTAAPASRSTGPILHARGDDRDVVDVFLGTHNGAVRLDGDNTRFVEWAGLPPPEVLHLINFDRIRRGRAMASEAKDP